ncbi:MAG TPA: SGNH/GDSL hydrolase family protein [Pyrinomonadaceae bacterium]|nr:SGNH/GDSL hydrolase family protein [Pyrinomonadaceae bacterium]
MKAHGPLTKRFAIAALAALLLLYSFARAQTTQSNTPRKIDRPLNLLVLGDSISWGQGLKDEHKAWYLVKTWLRQNTGREVLERIEAHSGAVIGTVNQSEPPAFSDLDGELSRGYPTINGQLDHALKMYADPLTVDLVIVDGCINDLDSRRLLNAANTPDGIRELAQAKCGLPVEALLMRITNVFPNAHVVITGYYPILSEKSANDLFMRALAKRFYLPEAGTPKITDKILRARLIAISREWYHTSDQMLSAAARKVDAQLQARGSHQRALFADAGFHPDHSFAANHSRLWGFDASAVRKLLVVLSLGRVQLRANDERRTQRDELCKALLPPALSESPEQKVIREDRLLRCKLAAVGHPNRKGAAMYADAIGTVLKPLLANSGWIKDANTATTAVTPQR